MRARPARSYPHLNTNHLFAAQKLNVPMLTAWWGSDGNCPVKFKTWGGSPLSSKSVRPPLPLTVMKSLLLSTFIGLATAASALAADNEAGFTPIFDGKSFDGWKIA